MNTLTENITPKKIAEIAGKFDTPFYLYDEATIVQKCQALQAMPHPFGLTVRYAMKANSTQAILQLIHKQGLRIDASSLNEVRRADLAGIPYEKIMLTTQEVPLGQARRDLEKMIQAGLKYNVCSERQLALIANFAANKFHLSIRVHPGVGGSGGSVKTTTGDEYSCFGVHPTDLAKVATFAQKRNITFNKVHSHIGSGGDPGKWVQNIDRLLEFVIQYFPEAKIVNFGGGIKEARMPSETAADLQELGNYAKKRLLSFKEETGRALQIEIEPGTYVMANAGFLVTTVIDKKQTGPEGYKFLVLDGGMEVNIRPSMYGSEHPFYEVSRSGELIFSEFTSKADLEAFCVVGKCCESGDSQSLAEGGHIVTRQLIEPEIGDYLVIGGCGAYSPTMSPANYNSHLQVTELLMRKHKRVDIIRNKQTLIQLVQNEEPLA